MGVCNVSTIATGTNANESFDRIVEDCIYMHGDDLYNGTFSTCNFCGFTLKMDGKFKESNIKKAEKHIREQIDDCEKWHAYAVDMGIDHYEVVKSKLVSSKRKTWLYYYVANYETKKKIKMFSSLPDAKEFALKYSAEQHLVLYIGKCYADRAGRDDVLMTSTETIIKKSKPKTVPKGAVLREIHKYYFYGKAAV